MKPPQRRSSSPSPVAILRSELERLRGALRVLGGAGRQHLEPALVPIPVGGLPRPVREIPLAVPPMHLAFGRKKDSKDDDDAVAEDGSGTDADPDLDQLPPIPSALGAAGLNTDPAEDAATEDAVGSWRPLDSSVEEATPEEPAADSVADTPAEVDLPAWRARSFEVPEAPSPGGSALEPAERAPWGSASTDDGPATFTPAVVDPKEDHPDNLAWLQSGAAEETAPWTLPAASPAGDAPVVADSLTDPVADLEEIDELEEIQPETPQADDELGTGPEEPWTSATTVVEEAVIYQPAPPISTEPSPAPVAVLQTRSFPLPEGEVVFRNLRAGFTDPARLLRHLAGEGHTGVLHVQGVDGSNSYVVLVDGYVVAVASDHQGSITTTNRISFPNFPNSQDTINVITYPRQIARGLGLVLHAPLRFAGLGAMFVNLEGLRSYLSKYSSSGGLIVHAQDGIGVALFEDGKLVGAYANGNAPTSDLGQLRDLVKDLEAEIDVRFGGPQDLEPTPLDTLLSGHPL